MPMRLVGRLGRSLVNAALAIGIAFLYISLIILGTDGGPLQGMVDGTMRKRKEMQRLVRLSYAGKLRVRRTGGSSHLSHYVEHGSNINSVGVFRKFNWKGCPK